jgi:hypothetical protein
MLDGGVPGGRVDDRGVPDGGVVRPVPAEVTRRVRARVRHRWYLAGVLAALALGCLAGGVAVGASHLSRDVALSGGGRALATVGGPTCVASHDATCDTSVVVRFRTSDGALIKTTISVSASAFADVRAAGKVEVEYERHHPSTAVPAAADLRPTVSVAAVGAVALLVASLPFLIGLGLQVRRTRRYLQLLADPPTARPVNRTARVRSTFHLPDGRGHRPGSLRVQGVKGRLTGETPVARGDSVMDRTFRQRRLFTVIEVVDGAATHRLAGRGYGAPGQPGTDQVNALIWGGESDKAMSVVAVGGGDVVYVGRRRPAGWQLPERRPSVPRPSAPPA